MLQIKGFMSIAQLVQNAPGKDATLGELSDWSETYVKEKGYYSLAAFPGYDLTVFKAQNTVSGARFELTNSQVTQAIELVRELQTYATTHPRPYDVSDFRNVVAARFYNRIEALELAPIVDNGIYGLPEWVSWVSVEHGGVYVKLWLSDRAFRSQYDESIIESIMPLANMDDFFAFFNQVKTKLNARPSSWKNTVIEATRGDYPETYTRFYSFNFVNVYNPTDVWPVEFPALVYGEAGDNIDAIKDAIVEKILSQTKHTRQEWEQLFPDLFKRTEFVFFPQWSRIAIPNLSDRAALFSPILKPADALAFAKANTPFYAPAHVNENIYTLPLLYKSLAAIVVGGETNIDGKKTLYQVIPDYIVVNTASADFSRMDVKTQEWISMINEMLMYAETLTAFSDTPKRYRKITRNNILFLSGVYDNVNFLVAAKSNSIYSNTVNV